MDNLTMVEELVSKTGASYGEAKEALEYSHYNMLDAIVYLEQRGKKVRGGGVRRAFSQAGNVLAKVFDFLINTGIAVSYEGVRKFTVPLLIVLIFFELLLPIALISLFFGCGYAIDRSGTQTSVPTRAEDTAKAEGGYGFSVNPEK